MNSLNQFRIGLLGFGFRARSPNGKSYWVTQQTTNLLAIFSLRAEHTSFEVRFAVDRDGERFAPAIGRFTDLLLDAAERFDVNPDIVLCLRSIRRTERGKVSEIEVETAPFHRYRLRPQSDLTSVSTQILEMKFSTFDSDDAVVGLFIAVRLTLGGQGLRFTLSPETSSIQPYWTNTTLSAPFDDRNLKWRDLFIAPVEEDEASDILAEALECIPRESGRSDYLATKAA